MLTDLGKFDSEYSTNESIKTFRQLESIAGIEGCDKEYLNRIKIVVNVIDPSSDTTTMAKIKMQNSSTAFTDGIAMIDSVPTIVINSIPIPNTKSLANLLSHEVKHSFPYIIANLVRKHPLYKEFKLNMIVQNYIAYSNELDKMEHIVKTPNEWNIGGMPFNPLHSVISNNCILKLNNLLKKQ